MSEFEAICCRYCGGSRLRQVTNFTLVSGSVTRAHSCEECGALNLLNEGEPQYDTLNAQAEFHEVEFGWADLKAEDLQEEAKAIEPLANYLSRHIASLQDEECILDIGCGKGTLVQAFRNIGLCAFGVDGSRKLVELGNVAAACQDSPVLFAGDVKDVLDEIRESGRFNGYKVKNVIAWHVLEHIIDSKRVVSQIAEILPPGGVLCVQLPGISPANLISSHFFLSNKKNISKLADGLSITCVGQHVDIDNMYFTGFYEKGVPSSTKGVEGGTGYDGVEEAIFLLKGHVDWVGGELKERDGRISRLKADVERGEVLRHELENALDDGEIKIKAVSEQLHESSKKNVELSAQLAEFEDKSRLYETQFRVARQEIESLQTEVKRQSVIINEYQGMGPKQHFSVFLRKLLEGVRKK